MHGAIGQDEHHACAAGAAFNPLLELEGRKIGNEVGLPHVAAWPHRDELAFAAEMRGRSLPFRELEWIVENERLVVEEVELQAEIIDRCQAGTLPAAGVEMLVAGIERQREQALWSPFEAVLASIAGLDRRAAVARQHVDDFFIEVLLRRAPPGRWKIQHEDGYEVAAALEMGDGAVDAEPRPRPGLALQGIDAEILDD